MYCLLLWCIMGPVVSDCNKRLSLLSVIEHWNSSYFEGILKRLVEPLGSAVSGLKTTVERDGGERKREREVWWRLRYLARGDIWLIYINVCLFVCFSQLFFFLIRDKNHILCLNDCSEMPIFFNYLLVTEAPFMIFKEKKEMEFEMLTIASKRERRLSWNSRS